jgi:hypothetical protein
MLRRVVPWGSEFLENSVGFPQNFKLTVCLWLNGGFFMTKRLPIKCMLNDFLGPIAESNKKCILMIDMPTGMSYIIIISTKS